MGGAIILPKMPKPFALLGFQGGIVKGVSQTNQNYGKTTIMVT
jgi:hypothetical protein